MEIEIRSKENVKATGEVFTPFVIVDQMLELIPESAWSDPSFVFLEPTCGNGQFLVRILQKRVASGLTPLQALNTIIGLDISAENIIEARKRLYGCFVEVGVEHSMAIAIVENNIILVEDSLAVMEQYARGEGILAEAKFMFEDPTGNGAVK